MVALPIRYDVESLPDRPRIVLALLDELQYCPPVEHLSKRLRMSRGEVRKSLRTLVDSGYLHVREVPVVITDWTAVR